MKKVSDLMGELEIEIQAQQTTERPERPPLVLLESEFDPQSGREAIWAQREASAFAASPELNAAPYWLSMLGNSGTGKTMLARSAHRYLRSRGIPSQFWTWKGILEHLRQGHWDLKEQLRRDHVLIVDDIGSAQETEFAAAYLDQLADERLGKWSLWTSNLSLEQIGDNVSERVRSRMRRNGGVVVEILNTPPYCG